jgi:hypothetical protein
MGEIKVYILHEKIIQQDVKDKNKLFAIWTHQMRIRIHMHFKYHSLMDIE